MKHLFIHLCVYIYIYILIQGGLYGMGKEKRRGIDCVLVILIPVPF